MHCHILFESATLLERVVGIVRGLGACSHGAVQSKGGTSESSRTRVCFIVRARREQQTCAAKGQGGQSERAGRGSPISNKKLRGCAACSSSLHGRLLRGSGRRCCLSRAKIHLGLARIVAHFVVAFQVATGPKTATKEIILIFILGIPPTLTTQNVTHTILRTQRERERERRETIGKAQNKTVSPAVGERNAPALALSVKRTRLTSPSVPGYLSHLVPPCSAPPSYLASFGSKSSTVGTTGSHALCLSAAGAPVTSLAKPQRRHQRPDAGYTPWEERAE